MPEELKVYPNPISKGSAGTIEIGSTNGEALENVYFYDISGNELTDKLKYHINTNGELEFGISTDLSSGTYMIVLQYGINRIKFCKVVVE